jgi:hypothetical protein
VASQGLRTTLSRLRRAISEAAECDADRYLRVDSRITLDLDHVSIDARRLVDLVECAKFEVKRGRRRTAREHYLEAQQLYNGPLLSSEAVEPALQPRIAEYAALLHHVSTALAAMDEHGDIVGADREWRELAAQLLDGAAPHERRQTVRPFVRLPARRSTDPRDGTI